MESNLYQFREGGLKMRKKLILTVIFLVSIGQILSGTSLASTDAKSLVIKAKIDKAAKLIVDSNIVTFLSMDPDETKQVPALQNDIKVTVKARTGISNPVTLMVVADGDLTSGPDVIPAQNVTWQASGPGFLNGTLNKSAILAGSWTGSGVREGAFRYFLNNSWNYQKGEYQVTVTYTLTTP
jgi:hypothetical protein